MLTGRSKQKLIRIIEGEWLILTGYSKHVICILNIQSFESPFLALYRPLRKVSSLSMRIDLYGFFIDFQASRELYICIYGLAKSLKKHSSVCRKLERACGHTIPFNTAHGFVFFPKPRPRSYKNTEPVAWLLTAANVRFG